MHHKVLLDLSHHGDVHVGDIEVVVVTVVIVVAVLGKGE